MRASGWRRPPQPSHSAALSFSCGLQARDLECVNAVGVGGRRHEGTRNFLQPEKRPGQALGFFLLIIYQIKKKK